MKQEDDEIYVIMIFQEFFEANPNSHQFHEAYHTYSTYPLLYRGSKTYHA
ncbi:hypothetical protein WN55_06690 [Dufourea novaeangliae]|uniref:Uncharacterized protein n=1 Tax=Dufourea novaeangliae TaxID=178035 RepID=A0A154PQP2_DUFNO|nr:hypothetical protein WN55_06690 [Dufourea novaeangliae]